MTIPTNIDTPEIQQFLAAVDDARTGRRITHPRMPSVDRDTRKAIFAEMERRSRLDAASACKEESQEETTPRVQTVEEKIEAEFAAGRTSEWVRKSPRGGKPWMVDAPEWARKRINCPIGFATKREALDQITRNVLAL